MVDIASLGFGAETSQLVDAEQKLNKIVPAAGRAERAADRLNKMMEAGQRSAMKAARADLDKANALLRMARASDTANRSEITAAASAQRKAKATYDAARASYAQTRASNEAAAAAKKEALALEAAANAARKRNNVPPPRQNPANPNRSDPANNNNPLSEGGFKANVGNIAAQFQDIGVTAAMGMNPLLIALQQGTQLSMVLGGGLKALVAALATVFSPVALLTIALVALGAALIQAVNWTKLAQWGLNALADVLPVLAIAAAAAGAALTIAFAPAIATAIWSIATAITVGLMNAILAIVATIGAVPILIAGVIASFFIFRDQMTAIFGIDLIDLVKTSVNFIIGAFVGAYHDIEFLWSKFPDIIGSATIGAVNMVIRGVNEMLSYSEMAVQKLADIMNKIPGIDIQLSGSVGRIEEISNEAADRLAKAVGDRNKQLQKDLTTDYLGAMGGAITTAASSAADKIRKFAGGLGEDDKKKKKAGGGKTDEEKFSDIVNGAERTIASLQAERDSIGLSEEATARLKYETQLLNEAKQKNIDLTEPQRAQLMSLAQGMATLEVETKKAKEAFDFAKDTTKSFFSDLRSGLADGKSLWESFGDAAMNVLNKVIDKMLNDLIDAIFQVNKAGSGGGGGGIFSFLGSLFGGFGGGAFPAAPGGLYAKGGAFGRNGVKPFAKGGAFTNSIVSSPTMFAFANGGAFGVMGEAGPEAVMPLARGPDGSLGVRMADGAVSSGAQQQSGGNTVVSYQDNSTWNIGEGADKQTVAELKKAKAWQEKTFDARVAKAVQENTKRSRGN